MDYVLGLTRRRAAHGNAIIKTHSRVERERPMLRKTMIVLAAVAALCGGLTDDAFALATGDTVETDLAMGLDTLSFLRRRRNDT
jgi:hypothetical protein